MRLGASHTPDTIARRGCASEWIIVNLMHRVDVIRVLCGRFFVGYIVSVGYAIAHPRLNPVGILPPGSRPSDVAAVCIHLCRVCNRAAVVDGEGYPRVPT